MPRTIRFQRTTSSGPELAGYVTLLDSGEVQLRDMDDSLRKILEAGVIGIASQGTVKPADGLRFLIACLYQFKGSYMRAVVDQGQSA